jgi:endo-1,4-beta-xylanase
MHISRLDYDMNTVAVNLARLTALGLQVHITELDVSLPVDGDGMASEEDLQKQAAVYRGIVHASLQSPGCTAIQTWGFTDQWSSTGSQSHHTRGAALPCDRTYQPKPAYHAILEELASSKRVPR